MHTSAEFKGRGFLLRLLGFINSVVRFVLCLDVWIRYDFSWFEATLECGRVLVSESWG